MANMQYCRFENTSNDLRDCVRAMEEVYTMGELDLSASERDAMQYMKSLCKQFLEEAERLEYASEEIEVDSWDN